VTRAVDGDQDQKAEPYAAERVEDGLHADAVDDVDEQAQAEEESHCL
jgi:hypothetical protein